MNEHKMPVILIADNEHDVAQYLRVTFRLAGFEAYTSTNANETIDRVKEIGKDKVDVVCMDGKLASDRGTMLIVNIKKINPKIKIFVVADRYIEHTKIRVLDYGANEFVLKPISLNSIVEKVNMLLLEATTTEVSQ
jgi:DNA-binding response OmpR family regulator